jgi:hypothetical protein
VTLSVKFWFSFRSSGGSDPFQTTHVAKNAPRELGGGAVRRSARAALPRRGSVAERVSVHRPGGGKCPSRVFVTLSHRSDRQGAWLCLQFSLCPCSFCPCRCVHAESAPGKHGLTAHLLQCSSIHGSSLHVSSHNLADAAALVPLRSRFVAPLVGFARPYV